MCGRNRGRWSRTWGKITPVYMYKKSIEGRDVANDGLKGGGGRNVVRRSFES